MIIRFAVRCFCWVVVFHSDRFHSQITYQSWKWSKFVIHTIRRGRAHLNRYHNDWSLFNWTHKSLCSRTSFICFVYFWSDSRFCFVLYCACGLCWVLPHGSPSSCYFSYFDGISLFFSVHFSLLKIIWVLYIVYDCTMYKCTVLSTWQNSAQNH